MEKVLITGGAGFIGSHLVDAHLARGDQVDIIDNFSTGSLDNVSKHIGHPNFSFTKATLEKCTWLDKAVAQADLIYHMAAAVGVKNVLKNPVAVIESNQDATERLLKSMQRTGSDATILIASSSEVYGFSEEESFKEDSYLVLPSADPQRWCYAMTKLSDEIMGFAYHYHYGLKTIVVRLFNTVGPRQCSRYGMVLPHFVEQAVNNQPVTVYGDGTQSRSFCDIRDMVEILTRLIKNPKAIGETVNAGSNSEITVNELAKKIIARTNSSSIITHTTYEKAYGVDFKDIHHRRPDLEKMISLTSYIPRYSLDDTIDSVSKLVRPKQLLVS